MTTTGVVSQELVKGLRNIKSKIQTVRESAVPLDVQEAILNSNILNDSFSFNFTLNGDIELSEDKIDCHDSTEKKKAKKKKKKKPQMIKEFPCKSDGNDHESYHDSYTNTYAQHDIGENPHDSSTIEAFTDSSSSNEQSNLNPKALPGEIITNRPAESKTANFDPSDIHTNVVKKDLASIELTDNKKSMKKEGKFANNYLNENTKISRTKKSKKAKKSKKDVKEDDDDALLNEAIAQANAARALLASTQKSSLKSQQSNSKRPLYMKDSLHNKAPIDSSNAAVDSFRFLSPKDPEITQEQRDKLKFGNAKNLVAIGPPRVRDNHWLDTHSRDPNLKNDETADFVSPFSFGFDAFAHSENRGIREI